MEREKEEYVLGHYDGADHAGAQVALLVWGDEVLGHWHGGLACWRDNEGIDVRQRTFGNVWCQNYCLFKGEAIFRWSCGCDARTRQG